MTRAGKPTVLIVDDEADIRVLVRAILEASSGDIEVVAEAVDGAAALDAFSRLDPPEVPDVVILDNLMPGMDGIDIAEEILRREPRQHVVLFSAYLDDDLRHRAERAGVSACVDKTDFDRLPSLVLELTRGATDAG